MNKCEQITVNKNWIILHKRHVKNNVLDTTCKLLATRGRHLGNASQILLSPESILLYLLNMK